jgi:hypothetical protein
VLATVRSHQEHWRTYPEYAGRWLSVKTPRWEPIPDAVIPLPWNETEAEFLTRAKAAYHAVAAGCRAQKPDHGAKMYS